MFARMVQVSEQSLMFTYSVGEQNLEIAFDVYKNMFGLLKTILFTKTHAFF